ncbi:glycogen/starch synthase, partial [bacterium]|nr:glycogen/starch synthase [bacterium]
VYFIDNEEYFKRKATFFDEEDNFFEDNDERSIFFCRGVFETVKKLGWMPEIIHCHGWFSALMAVYQKTFYADDPLFGDAKVVFSIYDESFEETMDPRFIEKLKYDGIELEDAELMANPSYDSWVKLAAKYSDGIVFGSEYVSDEIKTYVNSLGKPVLDAQPEEKLMSVFDDFYSQVAAESTVVAE